MSWRSKAKAKAEQNYDNRPAIGPGDMKQGDTLTLTFEDDGETYEGQYGEGVRFECVLEACDARHTYRDDSGNVHEHEDGSEVVLLTTSARLLAALASVDDSLVGKTVEIERTGESYDTDYNASEV
jgi:hypothetical protein